MKDLCRIMSKTEAGVGLERKFRVCVRLNGNHAIYAAHFPEKPITPGVCLIQICKEIMEREAGHPLFVSLVKNVKFLQIVEPDKTPLLDFVFSSQEEDMTYVMGTEILDGTGAVMAKINLVLCKENI
ncbi:MAG: hypothetical protein NC396_00860 [Bacteroides sp.]|nr:hypothetical protein [Bacteroides sp.]MCM1084872.1 hypothetical protein [Bacteroides sp.]